MQGLSRRRIAKFVADQMASGESTARVAKVLAAYLVENRATRLADILLRDIESALLDRHQHLAADVVSSRKLDAQTLGYLRAMLVRETSAQTAEILEQVDPSLIGGVIIRTPDSEMDASLKTKLMKLRAI